ncbi:hypothetical protein M3I54_29445 [Paraburkholderia sp. CNPSo 3274]|uniref:hypothetical protein n=1 Tax=Paraburkholderia sp. CNPSo 3274 TaxID=2940932 RepID=UPI0020B74591|nr:hypothetical protein [Paraburkholderia sp. CNPSo 3274]MCP3711054.1 hypothetical protein [Paraburkholderia sp. CNPSo 3274]
MFDLFVSFTEAAPQLGKQVISLLNHTGFEVYNVKRRNTRDGVTFSTIVRHAGDHTAALAAVQGALPYARINAQPFTV